MGSCEWVACGMYGKSFFTFYQPQPTASRFAAKVSRYEIRLSPYTELIQGDRLWAWGQWEWRCTNLIQRISLWEGSYVLCDHPSKLWCRPFFHQQHHKSSRHIALRSWRRGPFDNEDQQRSSRTCHLWRKFRWLSSGSLLVASSRRQCLPLRAFWYHIISRSFASQLQSAQRRLWCWNMGLRFISREIFFCLLQDDIEIIMVM